MTNSVRFMYIRDIDNHPVGCIAVKVNRAQEELGYAISVRHPVDARDAQGHPKPFNRKEAQLLALQRLVEDPITVSIPSDASQHEVTEAVMCDIISYPAAPARAIKFAKRWLSNVEKMGFTSQVVTEPTCSASSLQFPSLPVDVCLPLDVCRLRD